MFDRFRGDSDEKDNIDSSRRSFMQGLVAAAGMPSITSAATSSVSESHVTQIYQPKNILAETSINQGSEIGLLDVVKLGEGYSTEGAFGVSTSSLEKLPKDHPLRDIEEHSLKIPAEEHNAVPPEELSRDLENCDNVVEGLMEQENSDIDEVWDKLQEDAINASSIELEYNDQRTEQKNTTYVEVPVEESLKLNNVTGQGFYFGEEFDAWIHRREENNSGLYDPGALLIFEDGKEPEDVLTEEEYQKLCREDLSADQEVLAKIYESSAKEKKGYVFNFR